MEDLQKEETADPVDQTELGKLTLYQRWHQKRAVAQGSKGAFLFAVSSLFHHQCSLLDAAIREFLPHSGRIKACCRGKSALHKAQVVQSLRRASGSLAGG